MNLKRILSSFYQVAGRGAVVAVLVAALAAAVAPASNAEAEDAPLARARRTIGGSQFRRGAWPWLVLLRATIVTNRLFGLIPISHYHLYCGGVLISPTWLLSAAHCFTENGQGSSQAGNWEARLATVRLRPGIRQRLLDLIGRAFNEDGFRIWEIDVAQIVPHPSYNTSGLYSDDLALIRLARPIPNSRGFSLISNVTLPPPPPAQDAAQNSTAFPRPGQRCVTKGWGCTAVGGRPSAVARQVEMPVYNDSRCRSHYGLRSMARRVCAGWRNQGRGVCRGDSGSPLVCQDEAGRFVLGGVVSFTSRHNPESFPAVFTRVQDYLPWIQQVTGLQVNV